MVIKQNTAYQVARDKTDINWKLARRLRSRTNIAIRNDQKGGSAVRDLGCSIYFLKQYLESKFQPGMSWDNWTHTGWHIDHIKPLALFDLADPKQFKAAVHYSNLQPLWSDQNFSKGKSYDQAA